MKVKYKTYENVIEQFIKIQPAYFKAFNDSFMGIKVDDMRVTIGDGASWISVKINDELTFTFFIRNGDTIKINEGEQHYNDKTELIIIDILERAVDGFNNKIGAEKTKHDDMVDKLFKKIVRRRALEENNKESDGGLKTYI